MFRHHASLLLLLAFAHVGTLATGLASAKDLSLDLSSTPRLDNHLYSRETSPNGSTYLWLLEDTYAGATFFDRFDFFTWADPTNGRVNYVNRSTAFERNLTHWTHNYTKVVMKGDNQNWLKYGEYRDSVRIVSQKKYNSGSLFVFDIDKAPWGCAVWPAWWTVGDDWPNNGEIDIIEGVHDNEHNQVAWHTADGCWFTPSDNYTGTFVHPQNATCWAGVNDNAGCAVQDWSRASYGPYFDEQGGGVFVMKWDEESISTWSFYRSAIPADLHAGTPNPSTWGKPSAELSKKGCDLGKYFRNHSIIINLTFCGDWAGNAYPKSCPGTCIERLMDPNNFVNATWIINTLKVYHKQSLTGPVKNSGSEHRAPSNARRALAFAFLMAMGSALL